MKTFFTSLFLLVFTLGVSAQVSLIDFEAASDRSFWTGFANNPDAAEDLSIADNPDKSGINTSDSVLKYIVNSTGDPWVGAWSDNYGPIIFTADNHILTMMVYKTIVSPCGLKVEASTNGGPTTELKVSNTGTSEWELISIDFTACIGYSYPRLVIFPDFPDTRTGGTTAYIDNITLTGVSSVSPISATSMKVFPNPADEIMFVQAPDMTGYTITNMIGQTIRMEKFQTVNNRSVELSDMPTGVYFITIESLTGMHTSKFMVR